MNDLLVLRADATSEIGTGHVMRCLALAYAWKRGGGRSVLIGFWGVDWVRNKLVASGLEYIELVNPPERIECSEKMIREIKSACHFLGFEESCPDWVALDGYHFTAACHQKVTEYGSKLLVIDDYNHLPEYSADILLNQNMGAEKLEYHGKIKRFCLGDKYVLLRPEFLQSHTLERRVSTQVKHILITFGGSDVSPFFPYLLSVLSQVDLLNINISVIVGSTPPKAWELFLRELNGLEKQLISAVDDMPAVLQTVDFVITAGGSTCWELCQLGVPFSAVSIVENQRLIVEHLVKKGLAIPFSSTKIQDALDCFMIRQNLSDLQKKHLNLSGQLKIIEEMLG